MIIEHFRDRESLGTGSDLEKKNYDDHGGTFGLPPSTVSSALNLVCLVRLVRKCGELGSVDRKVGGHRRYSIRSFWSISIHEYNDFFHRPICHLKSQRTKRTTDQQKFSVLSADALNSRIGLGISWIVFRSCLEESATGRLLFSHFISPLRPPERGKSFSLSRLRQPYLSSIADAIFFSRP